MSRFVVAMIFALFISSGSLASAWAVHNQYAKKHKVQKRNLALLKDTRQRLEGVKVYGQRFDDAYPMIEKNPDMLSLYQSLAIQRIVPVQPDEIVLTSIMNVSISGEKTPLYEICISNGSSDLELRPGSIDRGLRQLELIDSRPDLSYTTVKLRQDGRSGVVLTLDSLCLLGRVDTRTEDEEGNNG